MHSLRVPKPANHPDRPFHNFKNQEIHKFLAVQDFEAPILGKGRWGKERYTVHTLIGGYRSTKISKCSVRCLAYYNYPIPDVSFFQSLAADTNETIIPWLGLIHSFIDLYGGGIGSLRGPLGVLCSSN